MPLSLEATVLSCATKQVFSHLHGHKTNAGGLGISIHYRVLWPRVTRWEAGHLQFPSQKTGVKGKITSTALNGDLVVVQNEYSWHAEVSDRAVAE